VSIIAATTDTAKPTTGHPGSASTPPPFDGALRVDLEGQRAWYECLRPACPHRIEGPVCSTDRVRGPNGDLVRGGPLRVAAFVEHVKDYHLTQYHPGEISQ
jgi:hypothetical protein